MKEKFSSNVFHLNFTEKKYPEKQKNGMRWKKKYSPEFLFHSVSQKGKNDPENKTISSFFLFHSISHMEKGFTDEKNAILNFGEKNLFS